MCSLAAAVQGMDETVNNGAQSLYLKVCSLAPGNSAHQIIDRDAL